MCTVVIEITGAMEANRADVSAVHGKTMDGWCSCAKTTGGGTLPLARTRGQWEYDGPGEARTRPRPGPGGGKGQREGLDVSRKASDGLGRLVHVLAPGHLALAPLGPHGGTGGVGAAATAAGGARAASECLRPLGAAAVLVSLWTGAATRREGTHLAAARAAGVGAGAADQGLWTLMRRHLLQVAGVPLRDRAGQGGAPVTSAGRQGRLPRAEAGPGQRGLPDPADHAGVEGLEGAMAAGRGAALGRVRGMAAGPATGRSSKVQRTAAAAASIRQGRAHLGEAVERCIVLRLWPWWLSLARWLPLAELTLLRPLRRNELLWFTTPGGGGGQSFETKGSGSSAEPDAPLDDAPARGLLPPPDDGKRSMTAAKQRKCRDQERGQRRGPRAKKIRCPHVYCRC